MNQDKSDIRERVNPPGLPIDSHASDDAISRQGRIRFRAILLGLVLSLAICAVTPFNNIYRQATLLGGGHFPLAPFFILFWLILLVALTSKIFKIDHLLTGTELLVSWILMVIASGIAYTGLARTFFINLTAPYHFATVENRWEEVLHPLMPEGWYPQEPQAISALYEGLAGGGDMGWAEVLVAIPWAAWVKPLGIWSIFILLCYFVMICIVNLISRQVLDNERMNYPLLRVPELLVEALDRNRLGGFLTDRFLLVGLSIPVFLHLLNGLNFYFPEVPTLSTLILAGPYFPKLGLFSGFEKLKIYIYPAFIGFAFLASKQISFSFWFFFILGGLMAGVLSLLGYTIPAAELGITFGPTLARPEETQMIGAYGVFFLFLFWLARHHFQDILKQSLNFGERDAAGSEWFAARFSFWGTIFGGLALVIWLQNVGVPILFSFLIIGSFFMIMLVASRVICQGGIAYFTLTAAPIDGLIAFFGPGLFTHVGILAAAVAQKILFVDLRESLMPSLFHARKITKNIANRRMIIGGILFALVAALVVSFGAMLMLCYKYGLRELELDWATRTTVAVYDNIYSLVESPVRPGPWIMIFSIVGALVMLMLVTGYHRFYWWPLHPIGYLTAYSSAMRILWFSFFVGWLGNALFLRYGGVALFKRFRFFFAGLIIGDFLMGGAWALVGLFTDGGYQVLPV